MIFNFDFLFTNKKYEIKNPFIKRLIGFLSVILFFVLSIVVLIVIGLTLSFVGAFLNQAKFVLSSDYVPGTVVDIIPYDRDHDTYKPIIAYRVNGEDREYSSNSGREIGAYEVGQEVELIINEKTGKIEINNFIELWFIYIMFLLFIFILVIFLFLKIYKFSSGVSFGIKNKKFVVNVGIVFWIILGIFLYQYFTKEDSVVDVNKEIVESAEVITQKQNDLQTELKESSDYERYGMCEGECYIKEIDFTFNTGDLGEVTYYVHNGYYEGEYSVRFSTEEIEQLQNNGWCDAEKGPLGVISKILKKDVLESDSSREYYNNRMVSGSNPSIKGESIDMVDYYLRHEGSQATCSENEEVIKKQSYGRSYLYNYFVEYKENIDVDKKIFSDELNISFSSVDNWITEEDEDKYEYLNYFCDSCKLIMTNNNLSCAIVAGSPIDNDERSLGQLMLYDKDNKSQEWRFLYEEDKKQEIQNEWGSISLNIGSLENRDNIDLGGINNDFKRSYKENIGYFSLLNYDGGIVNQECVGSFEDFISDIESYYSDYNLLNSSEGVLDIKRTFIYKDNGEKFNSHLIFNPTYNKDINLRVSKIDSSGLGPYFIKDNKIYFSNYSNINVYDLYEDNLVSFLPEEDEYITSIFLDNNYIYFSTLSEEDRDCLDIVRDHCRAKIHKMNLDGSDRKTILTNSEGLQLVGVNNDNVYLRTIRGYFFDIYKYDDSNMSLYKRFDSYTDGGSEDYRNFIKSINTNLGSDKMYVKEGEILPYEMTDYNPKYLFID